MGRRWSPYHWGRYLPIYEKIETKKIESYESIEKHVNKNDVRYLGEKLYYAAEIKPYSWRYKRVIWQPVTL